MRRSLTILTATIFLLAAGTSQANPPSRFNSPTVVLPSVAPAVTTPAPTVITRTTTTTITSTTTTYLQTHGVKFSAGYYYKGRNHSQWSHFTWNATWSCTFYYDPSATGWYYWCGAQDCYYPFSYIDTAPPTPETPPVAPPPGSNPVQPFVPGR